MDNRRSDRLRGDDPSFQVADLSELTRKKPNPKSNDRPPVKEIDLHQGNMDTTPKFTPRKPDIKPPYKQDINQDIQTQI